MITPDARVLWAYEWLHRLGTIAPSPLIVARLDARRRLLRSARIPIGIMCVLLGIVWAEIGDVVGSYFDANEIDADDLGPFILGHVGLALAITLFLCTLLWRLTRVEGRLRAAMPTRTAHPAAVGVARVVGAGYLASITAFYTGGLLLWTAVALLAPRQSDRAAALGFVASVLVFAVAGCVVLLIVLRRPSVAADWQSLLVDDVLRTEDARVALRPYPAFIAPAAALQGIISPWLAWLLLTYAAIGIVIFVFALLEERGARRAAAVR